MGFIKNCLYRDWEWLAMQPQEEKLMEKQHEYELGNMDYQAKLNEEMAQRNQQRQNEYFGMTAEYNSAKN